LTPPERLQNRGGSSVFNYALVAHDFNDSFVEMHYANLRSLVDGSFKDREFESKHIQAGLETQNIRRSYTTKVPAITLSSILDECSNFKQIDFLSLDVEGYELDVLRGLNLDKYKPTYILVEANFFDEINDYLKTHYTMVEQLTIHDYLYRSIL
jgi:FkbM family methyltransferase